MRQRARMPERTQTFVGHKRACGCRTVCSSLFPSPGQTTPFTCENDPAARGGNRFLGYVPLVRRACTYRIKDTMAMSSGVLCGTRTTERKVQGSPLYCVHYVEDWRKSLGPRFWIAGDHKARPPGPSLSHKARIAASSTGEPNSLEIRPRRRRSF